MDWTVRAPTDRWCQRCRPSLRVCVLDDRDDFNVLSIHLLSVSCRPLLLRSLHIATDLLSFYDSPSACVLFMMFWLKYLDHDPRCAFLVPGRPRSQARAGAVRTLMSFLGSLFCFNTHRLRYEHAMAASGRLLSFLSVRASFVDVRYLSGFLTCFLYNFPHIVRRRRSARFDLVGIRTRAIWRCPCGAKRGEIS